MHEGSFESAHIIISSFLCYADLRRHFEKMLATSLYFQNCDNFILMGVPKCVLITFTRFTVYYSTCTKAWCLHFYMFSVFFLLVQQHSWINVTFSLFLVSAKTPCCLWGQKPILAERLWCHWGQQTIWYQWSDQHASW